MVVYQRADVVCMAIATHTIPRVLTAKEKGFRKGRKKEGTEKRDSGSAVRGQAFLKFVYGLMFARLRAGHPWTVAPPRQMRIRTAHAHTCPRGKHD
jgi:hypothetical protein